ncbi:MAG: rRNA pseudouridine synthase [Nitrospinaceae bacterium]|jgi:23S rRNA pseudouridine2605 synthase|nr:rRNA pseudouridine synthase [Nitrospinaceae bacterium]MBT3432826.1 rRNA pseudouridine synthase [Nitrospinaceae bacterium]MBT4432503.1 rRNA pseudouridine synthase [Nitrospinaceae bacterium]MBT5367225.1 rRNA pseudouridine synthase [Nitrospinaceae bacterium]MBT5946259.1 rRNA pseudouridine synthase [Nitrospinaceae bacterium]
MSESEIRLQKIIAQAGVASRREAERLIRWGRVSVNGETVKEMGAKADPARDSIKVEGKLISEREGPVYLAMNKPINVLTTMRDEEGKDRPTVAGLLPPKRKRVFPVGRLDFDAEGLLLLTNDGDLAHRLTHPRYEIPRVYEVKVKHAPDERAIRRLDRMAGGDGGEGSEGRRVKLMGRKTERNAWLQIELREGKNHQVKEMCEAVGHPVLKLVRRSYGGITTRGISRASIRTLTDREVARLKSSTGLTPGHEKSISTAPRKKSPSARPSEKKAVSKKKKPVARPARKSSDTRPKSKSSASRPKSRSSASRPKSKMYAARPKKSGTKR